MVVTSFRLPHPAPDRIITPAGSKQPADNTLVCTSLSACFPVPFLPYTLLKKQRIDMRSCFVVCANAEIGLHALQSSSKAFRDPFATSAKPCQRLLKPFCTRCKALSTTVDTILHREQSPVNNRWIHSTEDAEPCQQPLDPLCIA
jgi:hypothetical protein